MQEFTIDTGAWKAFWERWRDTVDKIPGLKEVMLEKIGGRVRETVRSSIDTSGLSDPRGRVKRWQNPHIGSGRGYVAVRADSVEIFSGYQDRQTKWRSVKTNQEYKMTAGALTSFLSSGHPVRSPSGRAKRYQPRARMTRVRGLDLYGKARAEAEKIAVQEAEDFLRRLTVTELTL